MNKKTMTRAHLVAVIDRVWPENALWERRSMLEMVLGEMTDALVRGDNVQLSGFGQFRVSAKQQRIGRNPRTGVETAITPRRVLTFKASKALAISAQSGSVRRPGGSHVRAGGVRTGNKAAAHARREPTEA